MSSTIVLGIIVLASRASGLPLDAQLAKLEETVTQSDQCFTQYKAHERCETGEHACCPEGMYCKVSKCKRVWHTQKLTGERSSIALGVAGVVHLGAF